MSKGLNKKCLVILKMLAFRVTVSYDSVVKFVDKLSDHSEKLIIYEHDASRIHIHGLVTDCKVSTDTLKNWIKNALNVTKFSKSDWSFITQTKQGDPVDDNFITYMSKGILQPRFVKGYTDDVIEQFKSNWKPITPKTKVQYVLKQENPHQAKLRQNDMIDEICRRVDSQKLVLAEDIVNCICEVVYRENKTVTGRYKIRDYYDMVMYRTNKSAFIHQIVNLCVKV